MPRCKPCRDHLDQKFDSVKSMCAHHGVNQNTYKNRINRGMTLEQALDPALHKASHAISCEDPNGVSYPSEQAMAEAWGISCSTYRARMQAGWDKASALSRPANGSKKKQPERNARPEIDPDGVTHPSIKSMCSKYGVKTGTYLQRISRGWDKSAALSAPTGQHDILPLGKNGDPITASQACARWHVRYASYKWQKRRGKNPEQAFQTACIKTWTGSTAGHFTILACVQWPWFLVEDREKQQTVLNAVEICRLKNLLTRKQKR